MTINTNTSPYFDDFDETKGFYKILFRPGVAIQTREMTQLQTQLQNQIKKFGNHVFKNGTVILGAERFFESDLKSIKILPSYNGIDVDVSLYVGKVITGSVSGTTAIVKQVSDFVSSAQPKTFIVSVTSGSGFVATENITTLDGLVTLTATIQTDVPFGTAMTFSINEGVFYIDGYFVHNIAQSIIVEKYDVIDVNKSIGFNIVESIIDSDEDESLLDNAQGSPNFAAPGADRHKIYLDLVVGHPTIDLTYIELAKVVNGNLTQVSVRTIYTEIESELARRTYDESGNYTVRSFPISFKPHIALAKARPIITGGVIVGFTVTNSGVNFTSTPTVSITGDGVGATAVVVIDNNIANPTYHQVIAVNIVSGGSGYSLANTAVIISGDSNQYTVAMGSGKAYVKGYEFETTSESYLSADRARSTESANNLDSVLYYGNVIYTNNAFGVFDSSAFTTVELHNVIRTSVAGATTKIGSAKVRFLKYVSGTVGVSTAIYKMSLFDITMDSLKLFKDLESVVVRSGATVSAGYDLDLLSKVNGSVGGDAFLTGTDATSLVFPLNNSFVKELKDTLGNSQNDYTFQRSFGSVAFSGGTATIASNTGLERFFGGTGAYSDTTKDTYYQVVVTSVGTSTFTVGQVLRFNTGATRSITGGSISPSTAHQITFNVGTSVGFTATILATINANTQLEKTKSLQNYTTKTITTLNTIVGGVDSLQVADIYNVKAIYNTGTVNPTGQVTVNPTTGVVTSWGTVSSYSDVTSNYSIDNGQRDAYYDHGGIVLKGSAPTSTNYLVIVYQNFSHSGSGFLSVGSYSIPYENIPTYTSPTSGVTYNLRDSVDFRPRRVDASTSLANGQLPDPDFTFNSDYQYYVGRIDKVIASSGKSLYIKKGLPSSIPNVPSDDSDGMTLYVLEVPPYTGNLQEISVKYIQNKRYTMRDIGKLERRIENIEYYTQLSLLEKQAKDESITDASNIEKFKNGFFVDSFTSNSALFNSDNQSAWSKQIYGWWNYRDSNQNTWNKGATRLFESSVSDSNNVDYHVAIDPFNSQMRSEFVVNNLSFSPISYTNASRSDDIVTLGYVESGFISQLSASKSVNVNPYNILTFNGKIKLNPPNDTWVDTAILPAINRVVDIKLPDKAPVVNTQQNRTMTVFTGLAIGQGITGATSVPSSTPFKVTSNTTANVETVIGLSTTSLGSSVVDLQYAPYMRTRKLYAFGSGFKPNSRLYPFLDNESLSTVTKPNSKIVVSTLVGSSFSNLPSTTGVSELVSFRTGSITGTIIGTAYVGYFSEPSTSNTTQRSLYILDMTSGTTVGANFVTGQFTNSASVVSIVNYNNSDAITPDEFGIISYQINIPSGKYTTGDRTIRLIDSIDNDFDSTSSIGEVKYFTQGVLKSTQDTILTTRSVQNQKVTTILGFYYDPLAQSFLIDPRANPDGVHISSIDLYFKTKSANVPVTLEIRRTVNGFPESAVTSIPFASVTLSASKVKTSSTGSVSTNFKLDAPIHLAPGEYAIVVISNSVEYEVFVAQLGKTDLISNQIISKQPYTGVFFKSQNAATWTAIQEEDLKFKINSAVFKSTGVVEFGINDNESLSITGTLTNTSAIVSIADTSKLAVNDYVYATGIPTNSRVLSIQSPTQFTLTTNATVSVVSTITVIPYITYQTLHINSSNVLPTGTKIVWSVKLLDSATGVMDSGYSNVNLDIDSDFPTLKAIKPFTQNSNTNSIILRADLSTSSVNLSPVIDVAGLSAIFTKNLINNTSITPTDNEAVARGGDALARYITKKITLADGFDASNLVVTLDAYKPTGTDVRVYYKASATESTTPFENNVWIKMSEFKSIPSSVNANDFREHKFYPANAFDVYGVPLNAPISPRFNTWAIKIVLVSNSEAITPIIRDLRAISLDA